MSEIRKQTSKELEKKILDSGGRVASTVSGKTTILVHKDDADKSGSKYKKANELKIKIMSKIS